MLLKREDLDIGEHPVTTGRRRDTNMSHQLSSVAPKPPSLLWKSTEEVWCSRHGYRGIYNQNQLRGSSG